MPEIITQISESVSAGAAIKRVFGDKVEIDGVEAVPVAIAGFGFGGGTDGGISHASSDDGAAGGPEAGGGGGSAFAIPVGVMVRSGDKVVFEPEPVAVVVAAIPLVLAVGFAAIPLVLAVGFAASRIIRALRA